MNIKGITSLISKTTGRGGLILRKSSPEILLVGGIVGVGASTIMACRATLKADEVIENANSKLERIHKAHEMETEDYTETDYKKDLFYAYMQTGWDFVKLYGPSVTLSVLSVSCILGSHNIMKKRNIALTAAYKAVEKGFSDYRKRVVDELGEEKDKQFKYGIKKEKITVTEKDENGKDKKVKKTIDVLDPNGLSQYARVFDDNTSTQWSPAPGYNQTFLITTQNYMNDKLKAKGHVFLNEVYDALGLPRSSDGAIVGWVFGNGDDFIDFNMFEVADSRYLNKMVNDTLGEQRASFINGNCKSTILDFNVDGVIWDLI